ncbi:MAG: hypothetical protein GTN86_00340 [Xanthomonadales bacterium]|nr:hypothetical protein [Xanthomonadales bacterium]NIN74885.1 hypothetical protein [Xanthomonadales bacterium]NIO14969.1 hypothetical protein [Xanthomonadales bacterium]NIP11912.1 hypothetical protein [Xanthomonadales bacterium]NIP17578.1 hypothetical protein [Xanthomonadales bacterium]
MSWLAASSWLPAALLAAGLSWLAVGMLRRHAVQKGIVALPGARQSHDHPVPTGGGLGLVAAICLVSLISAALGGLPVHWVGGVLPGMAILSVMGWMDDSHFLGRLPRLLVQFVVSLSLVTWLASGPQAWSVGWVLLVGTGLVWVMNMYNFMDGSHGMAGFQGVFAGLVSAVLLAHAAQPELALAALVVAAACAGFLPWNFPRPRIFLGDAGSVPLGFGLGALLLLGVRAGALEPMVAFAILSLFLVDSTLTLLVRVIRGERWYTAHKQHLYQRLIAHGWTHGRVLALYQAVNMLVVTPAIVLALMYPKYAWPITGLLALVLAAAWRIASLRLEVQK